MLLIFYQPGKLFLIRELRGQTDRKGWVSVIFCCVVLFKGKLGNIFVLEVDDSLNENVINCNQKTTKRERMANKYSVIIHIFITVQR